MAKAIKIVLTGGPCGGKTSALQYLEAELKKLGISVFIASECASELFAEGKSPEKCGRYEFHKELFALQLKTEKELEARAAAMPGEKAVILLDRGLLDSKAYTAPGEFEKYSAELGTDEEIIRNSYDAVFHLVTAANGAENSYNLGDGARTETQSQAKELDLKLLSVWVGTPHLRIIDNSTGFEQKLKRLLEEVVAVIGNPEPVEIERKFLIEMPDLEKLEKMSLCRKVSIEQAYFKTYEEGKFRIRRRCTLP